MTYLDCDLLGGIAVIVMSFAVEESTQSIPARSRHAMPARRLFPPRSRSYSQSDRNLSPSGCMTCC